MTTWFTSSSTRLPRRAVGLLLTLVAAGPASMPTTAPAGRFQYAGRVVDAGGQPVAGVRVVATHRPLGGGVAYIDDVTTDAGGRFKIDRARALSGATPTGFGDAPVRLTFTHPDHLSARLQDVNVLTADARTDLVVRLQDGRGVRGRVTDAAGKPVTGALVAATPQKAESDDASEYRRGTLTAADGTYALRGLPAVDLTLRVLAVDATHTAQSSEQIVPDGREHDTTADVRTTAVTPAADEPVHTLLGMTLLDVDARLAAAFHLPRPTGVLVLDPGPETAAFELGGPRAGDAFWIVGTRPVKDFADFKQRLLEERRTPNPDARPGTVRVVYDFARTDFIGTMTTMWTLSADDVKAISDAR